MDHVIISLGLEAIDRITALADPVICNLQITQCYSELSAVMAERTARNANWCTFATWASRQAGQTIRKEDLASMLEAMRSNASAAAMPQPSLAAAQQAGALHQAAEILKIVWEVINPAEAFERASQAVARGNQKVFVEIGREFARFYQACLEAPAFDGEQFDSFCEQLRPGDPPDGQRYLRQAFAHYYQALFVQDAKTRAELMLLANLEIGFHEQIRLQPEIREALDAGFVDASQFNRRLARAILLQPGRLPLLRFFVQRLFGRLKPFETLINAFIEQLRQQARLLITWRMMGLKISTIRLRLGEDLPAKFPPLLQHIENVELQRLLAQIDPTPDSPRQSGAVDWADLPDRIHFIAELFRRYQLEEILWAPPFAPEQVAALKDGHLPLGRL